MTTVNHAKIIIRTSSINANETAVNLEAFVNAVEKLAENTLKASELRIDIKRYRTKHRQLKGGADEVGR